jgi:hypothetical protein
VPALRLRRKWAVWDVDVKGALPSFFVPTEVHRLARRMQRLSHVAYGTVNLPLNVAVPLRYQAESTNYNLLSILHWYLIKYCP